MKNLEESNFYLWKLGYNKLVFPRLILLLSFSPPFYFLFSNVLGMIASIHNKFIKIRDKTEVPYELINGGIN